MTKTTKKRKHAPGKSADESHKIGKKAKKESDHGLKGSLGFNSDTLLNLGSLGSDSSLELGETLKNVESTSETKLEPEERVKASKFDGSKVPLDLRKAMHANDDLMPKDFGHYHFEIDDEFNLDAYGSKGPQSPGLQVNEFGDDLCGTTFTSIHEWTDEEDKSHKRPLVDFSITQTKPQDATFDKEHDFPMEKYPSGIDRGHCVDHADGNATSTSSVNNYTPQTTNYNEGLRNHVVRGMRNNGGGYYAEQNQYGDSKKTMHDGKLLPTDIRLALAPSNPKNKDSQHATARQWTVPQQGDKTLQGLTIKDGDCFLDSIGDSKVEPGTFKFETKEEKDTWKPEFSDEEYDSEDYY